MGFGYKKVEKGLCVLGALHHGGVTGRRNEVPNYGGLEHGVMKRHKSVINHTTDTNTDRL